MRISNSEELSQMSFASKNQRLRLEISSKGTSKQEEGRGRRGFDLI